MCGAGAPARVHLLDFDGKGHSTCSSIRCELPFRAMHIEDLTRDYSAKSDEELLRLAMELEELTPIAQTALTNELAKRRISVTEHLKLLDEEELQPKLEQLGAHATLPLGDSHRVSQFVAEVLTVYRNHFWLFVKLIAPAVIIGYIAVLTGRNEGREIAKHIPRGVEALGHKTEILESFLANQLGFFVSWIGFSVSFGAICYAVRRIAAGVIPSVPDSFAAVRSRMGPFLRISVLLYSILIVLLAAALLLSVGAVWVLSKHQVHRSFFTIRFVPFVAVGLALLVFSRFGLAIPALLLDSCRVGQAIFRSDKLTQGKWLTLAILLIKSVVGGYLAGMCPFWIAARIPASIPVPWFPWLLDAASVAAVIVVEPTMFIGFALLYLKMSALPTTPGDALVAR
jgi:hypothetical protein